MKLGTFCPKVFVVCDKSNFAQVYKKLAEKNKAEITRPEDYEVTNKGVVIFLAQTLMTWGKVRITNNASAKKNNLRSNGYTEMTAEQVLSS